MTSSCYETNWGAVIVIVMMLIMVTVFIATANGYGQDIDPCGASNLDMYKRLCDQKEIYELYNQLLNRTIEWKLEK